MELRDLVQGLLSSLGLLTVSWNSNHAGRSPMQLHRRAFTGLGAELESQEHPPRCLPLLVYHSPLDLAWSLFTYRLRDPSSLVSSTPGYTAWQPRLAICIDSMTGIHRSIITARRSSPGASMVTITGPKSSNTVRGTNAATRISSSSIPHPRLLHAVVG